MKWTRVTVGLLAVGEVVAAADRPTAARPFALLKKPGSQSTGTRMSTKPASST